MITRSTEELHSDSSLMNDIAAFIAIICKFYPAYERVTISISLMRATYHRGYRANEVI